MKKLLAFLVVALLFFGANVTANAQPPHLLVYAYDASPNGALPVGPCTFYLDAPGTITSLADQSTQNFVAGGTWASNTWYGVVYSDNDLITIDITTGARTVVGNLNIGANSMNGMSYDYSTSVMYGIGSDGSATTYLYTVNLTTGAATLVGQSTTNQYLINLACDASGNLYAVNINTDQFGSVNRSTGLFTAIGNVGFNANFAQDMEFDRSTGVCYMAAYGSGGELRTVNLSTGATTLIGAFQDGDEITGLAIPYTPTPIPTLTEWAAIILGSLLLIVGVWYIWRRFS